MLSCNMMASGSHSSTVQDDAHYEVFLKMLGFFCALINKGYAFSSTANFPDSSDTIKQENIDIDIANPMDLMDTNHLRHRV